MKCCDAQHQWNLAVDGGPIDQHARRHVQSCPACRQYVAQMNRLLDDLNVLHNRTEMIVSNRDFDPPPPALVIRRAGAVPRLAAAAAIVLAVGLSIFLDSSRTSRAPVGAPPACVRNGEPPLLGISLQGESTARFIAVAEPTSAPNVQVFRLYSTLRRSSDDAPILKGT